MFAVLKRFSQVLMIAALLAATGGHWVMLQSLAWGRMIVRYEQTSGLTGAVIKTFDGNHPCSLCKSIEKTRAAEKKPGAQLVVAKMNLFFERTTAMAPPVPLFQQFREIDVQGGIVACLPLLRPPRESLG